MAFWGNDIFDNDATESALRDMLESPNPLAVVEESLALAQGELGELDDDEVAAIIASAAVVDAAVNGTKHDAHREGIARLIETVGPEALSAFEADLSEAVGNVLDGDTLVDFYQDADTGLSFEAYREQVAGLRQRLSPDYEGTQRVRASGMAV